MNAANALKRHGGFIVKASAADASNNVWSVTRAAYSPPAPTPSGEP